VVASTPSDGSYSWTIPNTPSDQCRVRVIDVADSDVFDTSNSNFTISEQGGGDSWVRVTYPNGGETLEPGSSVTITWESSEDFEYVRLDYSTNSGQTWTKIVSQTGNDGDRGWTVPNVQSDDCRVRVQSKDDPSVTDMSDRDFNIGTSGPGLALAGGGIPAVFDAHQNYPNPFNPSTQVRFDVPGDEGSTVPAIVNIYNARGKLVRKLLNESLQPGQYRIHWDGRSDRGQSLPSGIYLLYIQAGPDSETVKMILAK
jgi:hypothetical protein